MPITLPPISRRQFLASSAAGLAALSCSNLAIANRSKVDANYFALFSDTHIAGDPKTAAHGTNMTDNFAQATGEVLACDPRPTAVLVCGDCAYLQGKSDDYRQLHSLVAPLRASGIAVHWAMGNHDNRQRFWEVVEEGRPNPSPIQNRQVTVIETPHANWFLLDSLDETNKTPGVLGADQLAWLGKSLDQHAAKPALVMVHHNPDERPQPTGLVETRQLLDLLTARPHVKVLFHGHSHHLAISKAKQLTLVNLPPVAYLFKEGDPNGWVGAQLSGDGITLTLHCIDKKHPLNEKSYAVKW